jgi:FKBP-type peptidyl-prolyl cis-trans isomerase SlyD
MSKKVISFHYRLTVEGQLVESSFDGGEPLAFLQDSHQIIPGLERELIAMKIGDKKSVTVAANEAYGEVNPEMIVTVKKSQFPADANLQLGDEFQVNNTPESPIFRVVNIVNDDITIDGNHPMAGRSLTFDVEITNVRTATAEEMAHGHAHGHDGTHGH